MCGKSTIGRSSVLLGTLPARAGFGKKAIFVQGSLEAKLHFARKPSRIAQSCCGLRGGGVGVVPC
eukprot:5442879-Amphidinium_carterae.5